MKLLLLIVALIVTFKADCRHFSDGSTYQISTSDEHPLPEEPVNSDFTDEDQYNKGPESLLVEDENEQNEIALRGEYEFSSRQAERPTTFTTAAKLLDEAIPEESKIFGMSIEYSKGGKRDLQKLIKNFEFLKYNLTQDNLKIKMQLMYLKNITDDAEQLKMDLQSIKDFQNNITNADKELKKDFNSVIENITNGDLKLKTELQSIIVNQNNITHTNKNLKLELQSLIKNINDSNSVLKTDVNSMKSSINSYNSNIISKLSSIEARQGRLRHFPYSSYKKTWDDAKKYCESIGGQLWTPVDRAQTIAAFKACGTLCWNGWHKNSRGQWVTVTGELKNSNFWASSEPGSSDNAAWSSSTGIWGRMKTSLYGWTCKVNY